MLVLSLPFVLMTLGFFILIINAVLLYFVGHVVKGFHVDSFWAAFLGSVIIGIVSLILNGLTKTSEPKVRFRKHAPQPPPPSEPPPGKGPVIDV